MSFAHYRKALLGALGAALAFLAPVVDDGLTSGELLGALAAAVAAGSAVYGIPNRTPDADTEMS